MGSVVGIALLVAVTVLTATVVGATVFGTATTDDPTPTVSLSGSADATRDRIALTHRGGDTLNVSRLRLEITVDGEPLARQPPVPFFAATGFESGPTGPFNTATDSTWRAGETAAVRLAGTNSPELTEGARVRVRVYSDGVRLATVEATA